MRNQSGFSLIQLIIVIIITSLGLAAAAQLAKVEFQERREDTLITSFQDFNEALLAYYNGVDETNTPIRSLPCPARQDLAIDHPDFGKPNCAAAIKRDSAIPHPDIPGRQLRVMIGALPTRELSLPTEAAIDVFGGQYVYAVSEELTSDTNFLRNDLSAVQRVNDGGTVVGLALPYIVVSMGDNSRGAYNEGGVLISDCPNAAISREGENCDYRDSDDGGVFLDGFINEADEETSFYDDRVGFDGTFFARAGRSILVNLECPAGEFLTGVQNGEPRCEAIISGPSGGGNACGGGCGGGCGCDNVCVCGVCVEAAVSACK